MNWFGGLIKAGKAGLTGVNWQLWLWKIGLGLALLAGSYGLGVLNTKQNYAEAEAQRANVRAEQIVKVVEKRIPVVQVQEKIRTKVEYDTKVIYKELTDENESTPTRAGCELSPTELHYYREVAKQTRLVKAEQLAPPVCASGAFIDVKKYELTAPADESEKEFKRFVIDMATKYPTLKLSYQELRDCFESVHGKQPNVKQ